MTKRGPRYSFKEFSRRGREIYERDILPNLKPEQMGMYVAIDIETGAFKIDRKALAATMRLFEKDPDAQIWMEQAAELTASRIGWRGTCRPLHLT